MHLNWLLSFLFALWLPAAARASGEEHRAFDIPAGDAINTLKLAARVGGVQVVFLVTTVEGVKTNPVRGRWRPREALDHMVANTGLKVVWDARASAFSIERATTARPAPAHERKARSRTSSEPTTPMRSSSPSLFTGLFSLLAGLAVGQPASTVSSGTVEGRVQNPVTGAYLDGARLTVQGTTLESFSDADGNYRLTRVPAGAARVTAFYTGFPAVTHEVIVTPGQVTRHDIHLSTSPGGAGPVGAVVRMGEFVVNSSRQMDAAALAINEQRFASNIKNVVAAQEFGAIADGNAAEFMKFLPGVTIDYVGGDAREISIDGVPTANVPVTLAGFSFASTAPNNLTGRAAQIGFFSINSLSRIEVSYSPTPESEGAALAGSVNMVPRSAFESSRRSLSASAFVLMRDNARDFHRTPGPGIRASRKVHPGFEFSGVVPVNSRFGLTLSGSNTRQYSGETYLQNGWRGAAAPTNGTTFPHTTFDRPYLTTFVVGDRPKVIDRSSAGLTADIKLTRYDRLSLSFQYSTFGIEFFNRELQFDVNRVAPGDFTTSYTHGYTGAGSLRLSHGGSNRKNNTIMPSVVWQHDGPLWKSILGAGYSRATYNFTDVRKGFLGFSEARRTGVTVSFDDIFYLRPRQITVTDGATGALVDPFSLANYSLTAVSTSPFTTIFDIRHSAYGNLRRDFHGRVPVAVKIGFDVRRTVRDIRGASSFLTPVGADGRTSTTPVGNDDSAAPVLDAIFSQRIPPFGFPPIQWVGNAPLLEYYRANPTYFTDDPARSHVSEVNQSKRAEELVSAIFFRGDVSFFDRRLKLVGGVRAEQTNIDAEGPLTDPTRNFQRDNQGRVVLGAEGLPLPIATDPLGRLQRTLVNRGGKTKKEYLTLFPSLNASFGIRENLIVRAAAFSSIGRPDFNQYAGGVSLPDLESAPSFDNRINVNNVGIKPWQARSVNARVEYYFEGVGQVSLGAFRREFKSFWDAAVTPSTPEFLALYGLDAGLYGPYDVGTQTNRPGTVRIEGTNFSYKQALTFLPRWARGVQVFANASAQRVTGERVANFSGAFVIPRSGSWGVSLDRERYNVRVNWNYRGRHRRGGAASGPSIEPGTYTWFSKRLAVDVMAEYRFLRKYSLFANLRNIGDTPDDVEIAGPSTPPVAQFRQRQYFGSLWSFGVRATY